MDCVVCYLFYVELGNDRLSYDYRNVLEWSQREVQNIEKNVFQIIYCCMKTALSLIRLSLYSLKYSISFSVAAFSIICSTLLLLCVPFWMCHTTLATFLLLQIELFMFCYCCQRNGVASTGNDSNNHQLDVNTVL